MSHGVLMHVIQPGQVGLFKRQPGIPEVELYSPAGRLIEAIHFGGRGRVKVRKELCNRIVVRRGVRNEMVMIREDRPRLQRKSVLPGQPQQLALQERQPLGPAKEVLLLDSRRRYDERARFGKSVCGSVRPVGLTLLGSADRSNVQIIKDSLHVR